MKTYNLSESSGQEEFVYCPHCAVKNPKKSYACHNCFKPLSAGGASSVFRAKIHPTIAFLAILTALVLSAMYLGNKWLDRVEANLTLSVKTATYDLEMTAEKRKTEELKKEISLTKNPSE